MVFDKYYNESYGIVNSHTSIPKLDMEENGSILHLILIDS